MHVLAIIPARGNSKGIPRKNLAPCAGLPLVDWTVAAANESQALTDAVLSSDDQDILNRASGRVRPLWRPEIIARDNTSTESVMASVLSQQEPPPDVVVLLQPTSPLRDGRAIDEAVGLLVSSGADSVVSVSPSHAYLWSDTGPLYFERLRRQEMTQFEENGAIYAFTYRHWRSHGNRLGGDTRLYVMGEEHRLQVDSPLDLELVSYVISQRETTRMAVSA